MNRFSQAAGVWRSLRARVLNLKPQNPWLVVWNPLVVAYAMWAAARGVLPWWLAAGGVCWLIFCASLHACVQTLRAERAEAALKLLEPRVSRAEALVKALDKGPAGMQGYSTRAEAGRLRRNMN